MKVTFKNIEIHLETAVSTCLVYTHISKPSRFISGRFFNLHRSSDGFFRCGIFPHKKTGTNLIERSFLIYSQRSSVKNHNFDLKNGKERVKVEVLADIHA